MEVSIPAGIDDRQIVNIRGQGNAGLNGGRRAICVWQSMSGPIRFLSVMDTTYGAMSTYHLRKLRSVRSYRCLPWTARSNMRCLRARSRVLFSSCAEKVSKISMAAAGAISLCASSCRCRRSSTRDRELLQEFEAASGGRPVGGADPQEDRSESHKSFFDKLKDNINKEKDK